MVGDLRGSRQDDASGGRARCPDRHPDWFDDEHWKTISTGGGVWFPPAECLEETEALALVSLLRPFTTTTDDAWFMLWDGYGDLGAAIDVLPRGMIHRAPDPPDLPAEVREGTLAFRHYHVFRGPLDAVSVWYGWRDEGPNYLWPDTPSKRCVRSLGTASRNGDSRTRSMQSFDAPTYVEKPSISVAMTQRRSW